MSTQYSFKTIIYIFTWALFAAHSQAMAQEVFDIKAYCAESLSRFNGYPQYVNLDKVCAEVQVLDKCESVQKRKIFHYNKVSSKKDAPKILVFSLIHGDETPAGSVGRMWIERLNDIDPRNTWRVIPVLNPDGVVTKTRTNANKIDLNRNFPTSDWSQFANQFWKEKTGANPRRFPGDIGGSEPETQCALQHIEDFQPDFTVSIHTPLKVLDFDGPNALFPKYEYLPWKRLGHFPGSLGRYLWFERQMPVLTLEWNEFVPKKVEPLEKLHDVIGQLVKMEIYPKKKSKVTQVGPTSGAETN